MADHLLFGILGAVIYQGTASKLSARPVCWVLTFRCSKGFWAAARSAVSLDLDVVGQVKQELVERIFANILNPSDQPGRVVRYAKTHGPLTADQLVQDLGLVAASAAMSWMPCWPRPGLKPVEALVFQSFVDGQGD
ncbi:hypothetical protein CRD60_03330 [Bifidobacterium aemilianum]|uniref:Uncharacterized protein n=1 Tax=Bifidobacterium aemilianum TaxID=2493120 RepID=A0A366K8X2_9BIFI|nr:hypothetical protein [Bifidobacterium aemilianum]RBP98185.1 hypothetical protein CRD60_03330 [Bifidobacterium aemilianum]